MDIPWHPALVHLPLALAVILPLLALGITLALWRGLLPARSWVLVVAFQGLLVATGLVSLRLGEQDEERVERVVAEHPIEHHEEAAKLFMWVAGAVLLASLGGLFLLRRERALRMLALGVTAATAVVTVLALRTGYAGGELVYVYGAASAYTTAGGAAREHEHDHD